MGSRGRQQRVVALVQETERRPAERYWRRRARWHGKATLACGHQVEVSWDEYRGPPKLAGCWRCRAREVEA